MRLLVIGVHLVCHNRVVVGSGGWIGGRDGSGVESRERETKPVRRSQGFWRLITDGHDDSHSCLSDADRGRRRGPRLLDGFGGRYGDELYYTMCVEQHTRHVIYLGHY